MRGIPKPKGLVGVLLQGSMGYSYLGSYLTSKTQSASVGAWVKEV